MLAEWVCSARCVKHAVRHFLVQKECTNSVLISLNFPTPALGWGAVPQPHARLGPSSRNPLWASVQAAVAPTANPSWHETRGRKTGRRAASPRNRDPRLVRVSRWFVPSLLAIWDLFPLSFSTIAVACAVPKERTSPCSFSHNNNLYYCDGLNIYLHGGF